MSIATTIRLVSSDAIPYFTAILNRLRRIRAWFEAKDAAQQPTKLDIIDKVRARAGLNQVERIRGQMHWQVATSDDVRSRIVSQLELSLGTKRDDHFVPQVVISRFDHSGLALPGAKESDVRRIAMEQDDPIESRVFERAFSVIESIDVELGRSPAQNVELNAPDPWMQQTFAPSTEEQHETCEMPAFDYSFYPKLSAEHIPT